MSTNVRPTDVARVTTPGEREIQIERDFQAPRARVWRAFTEPRQIAQWWGRGNKVTIERLEAGRGGHWRFVEHANGAAHGFEGRFREVSPPERLVQTFEWDGMPGHVAVVTTTFDELDQDRTRVVTHMLFHTAHERDAMIGSGVEGGLNGSFGALEELLARRG